MIREWQGKPVNEKAKRRADWAFLVTYPERKRR
jgi:hypothetical protein